MSEPLDYESKTQPSSRQRFQMPFGVIAGAAIGVLLMVAGIFFVVLEEVGHQPQDVRADIFPLSTLLMHWSSRPTSILFLVGLSEIPIECGLIGWSIQRRRWVTAIVVVAVHFSLAMLAK